MFSLAVGTLATGISVFVYLRQRLTSLMYFSFFLVSLLLFFLSFITSKYSVISGIGDSIIPVVIAKVFAMAGSLLFISIAPFLYHALIGNRVGDFGRVFTGILVAADIGLLAAGIALPGSTAIVIAWITLLAGMIAYGIIYIGINLRNVGEKSVRKGILVFILVTALYLPMQIIDYLLNYLPELRVLSFLNNLAQPLYFLIISVLFVSYAIRHFSEPAYYCHGALSDHFREKFRLSEREGEIVQRLLLGESAKQVAEVLHISSKTVENHVYNIFKKCDINSRLQLHQLVFSNASK
jgi:DNA-binding CsgD family transcriptional regulator